MGEWFAHYTHAMHLEVLVFGQVATIAECDRVRIHLARAAHECETATVREVLTALGEQHPDVRFALASARIAVNHSFAGGDATVTITDELALISLVGGG